MLGRDCSRSVGEESCDVGEVVDEVLVLAVLRRMEDVDVDVDVEALVLVLVKTRLKKEKVEGFGDGIGALYGGGWIFGLE